MWASRSVASVGKGTVHFQALGVRPRTWLTMRATLSSWCPSRHFCVGQPQSTPIPYQLKHGRLNRNLVASSYSADS